MHDLFAIAGMLLAAAATPGPNNLVVLHAAGRGGMRAALPAIGGIVCGGLVLLAVVAAGTGRLLAAHAELRIALGVVGGLYMGWLGVRLLCAVTRDESVPVETILPAGALGLFGFQFLNPKGWAMVLTIVAAWPAAHMADYLPLGLLFTLIPLACLVAWAAGGRRLAARLSCPRFRRHADVAMGVLLLASGALLLADL